MKESPSVTLPVKQKLGKKKNKRKRFHELGKQNENHLNENGESVAKKKVKKIKIRLADPDIPDSYICEVFDSSLEREEEEEKKQRKEGNRNGIRGRDESKHRNFFDVLMSKDSRKNFTVDSARENDEIPEETKLLREVESDEVVQKRKSMKAKNKGKLVELVKRKKKINGYCSDSSDDDSIFEVQSSIRFFTTNLKGKNSPNPDSKAKNKENTAVEVNYSNEDSSKSDLPSAMPKKKNSNILNYFSKKDVNTIKPPIKEINSQMKPRKLTEINMFDRGAAEKKAENVKLAPLFQKRVKTVVDPKVQKARKDFLQNGLPTNMKKIMESKKNVEDNYPEVHFPDVSHVQQKDDDPLWCSEEISISLLKKTEDSSVYRGRGKTFRFAIGDGGLPRRLNKQKSEQNSLNNLRLRYKDMNIDSIFNSFKEKKDNFTKRMEVYDKGENSDDSIEVLDEFETGDDCYSLWTNVYKPKSGEIFGNKVTVAKLSRWLKSWKEYNEVKKPKGRVQMNVVSSSSEDSMSSDEESTSERPPVNMCLLSGPIASGKTSLVYALATEFDYNVLEVNSSSRRTGKKLLVELQEATKSHEVRSGLSATAKDEKMREKTKKKREDKKTEPNSSKISLILIEDADIFFDDHDEGFVSAISTLVQSSKRPFIFLSNDPNYGYLDRLKQQQNQILLLEMQRPNFHNSCAILDVIAAVEGVSLDRKTLNNLITGNKHDLRKSIMELQFWVQSGKELVRDVGKPSDLGKLWWGLNKFLYRKDAVHVAKIDYKKRKRSREWQDSSEAEEAAAEETPKKLKLSVGTAKIEKKTDSSIHSYTRILDSISVGDLFKFGSDVEPIPSNECRKPKDGLSLDECMESVDWKVKDLSGLIIEELVMTSSRVFASCNGRNSSCMVSNPSWAEIRWRNLQQYAKQDLSALVPANGGNSRRNVHLDYLPIIRDMCRAEKRRYIGNTKRKNRFSHYFRTLGCEPRDESLEISCDVFHT